MLKCNWLLTMSNEEKQLYSRYYYNAVIEFLYFTILYIETYGAASLNNLAKHVKFFKKEVTEFLSSFEGKTLREELFQLLNTLDFFDLQEDEIKVNENDVKDVYLEDLVLSKCIDAILKGITNVDEVRKYLNHNNVIKISKGHFLCVIKKYSFISLINDKTFGLNHAHGLLGFEDNLYNSVVNYFYEILFRVKILSVEEIKNHGNLLKFCGLRNVMLTLAILNSSDLFVCRNGNVLLNKKSKKYPKKKRIDLTLITSEFLSTSLPISQIVFYVFGNFLHKWSGEIGYLNESFGYICCVVDFVNGQQGLFNVCFNIAALKTISDIENLKEYVNIRDKVEFDALYYAGKKLERCWWATNVRLLSSAKLEYNETVEGKLTEGTYLYRNNCSKCSYNFPNTPKPKLQEQLSNRTVTSDYDSLSGSLSELDTANRSTKETKVVKSVYLESLTNLKVPEYAVMFGYVHILMEDKTIAIATHEGKIYNVLFLKDSSYVRNSWNKEFKQGQKVVAFVPYIDKLEAFCVATLVSSLSEKETDENEILSAEFLKEAVENFCCNFCVNYPEILSGTLLIEKIMNDLKLKLELSSLFNLISDQHKKRSQNYLLRLLYSISKLNCNRISYDSRVSKFMVKLSKSLVRKRNKRKQKMEYEPELEVDILPANFCLAPLAITVTYKNDVDKTDSSLKCNSLDLMQGSLTSLSSFKTCCSEDSSESFYSCEDKNFPKCLSNSTSNEEISKISPSQLLRDDIRSDLETNCDESSSKRLEKPDLNSVQPKYLPDSSVNEASSSIAPSQLLQSGIRLDIESDCIESSSKPDPAKQPRNFEVKIHDVSGENDLPTKSSPCESQNECNEIYVLDDHKSLPLQSVPSLKSRVKKNKVIFPHLLKPLCSNCSQSSCDIKAHVSLITNTFIFLTTEINGQNVVLPVSKQNVPSSFIERMKLHSCSEITVIPAIILNLSHVKEVRLGSCNEPIL